MKEDEFNPNAIPKAEKEKIPEFIEFGKVRLERVRSEHAKILQELLSDKENLLYTEFTQEDGTEKGCQELINGWGDYFPFAVYDRKTNELIGFEFTYLAECPYKNDPQKAEEWTEKNQNTWESGRIFKKSATGYGTDTKKAVVKFVFDCLKANAYTLAYAIENKAPITSGLRAGLQPDKEFRGKDLKGEINDGINEEGFYNQFGDYFKELRLKITRAEYEEKKNEGVYDDKT